ncbi:transposase [uncultured Jannaschia sp.]|uniref:IS66 family transposase n=1 Tax=uncultured Jannaschia sp. TaxID=293347 RepID=UPI00345B4D43
MLQADAYSGFRRLYGRRTDGSRQFVETTCRAHLRRDLQNVWSMTRSKIARKALDRIGTL